MRGEDSIREEFAKLGLGPAIDDEIGEQVEVGPRIDLMRDAACNNGEDGCGALATHGVVGKEPVAPSKNEPAQLTLTSIIGELDVASFKKRTSRFHCRCRYPSAWPSGVFGGMTSRCS